MFTEWFDLKFSTVIMDLVDKPILKEDQTISCNNTRWLKLN